MAQPSLALLDDKIVSWNEAAVQVSTVADAEWRMPVHGAVAVKAAE